MKIGLYFGSFNPIHIGHLIIANHIIENTDLDKIWFVVSPQNPFKQSNSLLNEYHRLHLVQIAIENDDRFKAIDVEFRLPKPSYTIDTLTYLIEKYPNYKFNILMGSDGYQNLNKWKNYEILVKHYPIFVYNRPEFDIKDNQFGATILDAPLLNISSTAIRKSIKEGRSIKYLVPNKVFDELMNNKYYR
jgi:nicotinate-nucleotide adenylyltransferase